jgi:hypothetical protein
MRWQAVFDMTILLQHSHTPRKSVETRQLSFALRRHSRNLWLLRWHMNINGHWFRGIGRVEAATTGAHPALTFQRKKCSPIDALILTFILVIPFPLLGSQMAAQKPEGAAYAGFPSIQIAQMENLL